MCFISWFREFKVRRAERINKHSETLKCILHSFNCCIFYIIPPPLVKKPKSGTFTFKIRQLWQNRTFTNKWERSSYFLLWWFKTWKFNRPINVTKLRVELVKNTAMHAGFEYHNKGCWAPLVLHGCFIKGIVSWLREPLSKEVKSATVFPDSTCQKYIQHEMISPAVLSHKLKGSAGQ